MGYDTHAKVGRERGFSLLEMLVVVAIIATMAAVALPSIGTYVRNYKIRGATQELAGEVQTARAKAIMTNTNAGVSFVAVDADSYRWVQEDLPLAEQLGPLKELPQGIRFVASGTAQAGPSLRFQRLGGFCNPVAGSPCAPAGRLQASPDAGWRRAISATEPATSASSTTRSTSARRLRYRQDFPIRCRPSLASRPC